MKMKNKIIYWRGGGYDGCIWEPNMGFFDRDGEWHPVISTGSGALDSAEDVLAEIAKENDPGVRDWEKFGIRAFPIDGDGGKCLEWLCANVRNDYVAVLADALCEADYSPLMKCAKCGEWFAPRDCTFRDVVTMMADAGFYRGDGGIGTITDDVWCDDCRDVNRCEECGEIFDRDSLSFREEFLCDWLGICPSCAWDILHLVAGENTVGDILDELEERIDGMSAELEKYLAAMKDGGTSDDDLSELRRKNEETLGERRKALVNEARERIEPLVRANSRVYHDCDRLLCERV